MKHKSYYICEYGVIRNQNDFEGALSNADELYLPSEEFISLYNYILANQPLDGDIPFSLFSKAKKLQIKVKNYVGLIETNEGVSLEILPKVYTGVNHDIVYTRNIFLKMLKALKDTPFIKLNTAHLAAKKDFPILEVFIKSYIEEAEKLFNKGVRSGYILKEDNLNYLKAKVLIAKNLNANSYNRSKFFCEFSELSEDISPNRLIKTTLLKLLKLTRNYGNYSQLNKLLSHLENVSISSSIIKDLRNSNIQNRLFIPYKYLLEWSELFLLNKGLTNFTGTSFNTAILFPMEKVFENYIAYLFRKYTNAYKIKAQDKSYFLVEKHMDKGKFRLRPDLYLEKNVADRLIVDTKWKLLDERKSKSNYDINIADMYQLFAYGKKYTTDTSIPALVIIYPKNENFTKKLESFVYEDGLILNVYPFDFANSEEEEIKKIFQTENISHTNTYNLFTKSLNIAAEDQADYGD